MMQISQKGLDLIKKFEGLKLEAYLDPAEIPTIGYGTIRYPNGNKVKLGDEITEQQAEAYLLHECSKFAQRVEELVTVPLNQNQFDALVSFCYNLGDGALEQSTLLIELNEKNYSGAAAQFPRWNKATVNDVLTVLAGLVTRRAEEKALFESTETGGTPIEVDTTLSPQEEVTWVESYRDGDKNVLVARNGTKVIEIITLERPNKEDLIAVLQQYPNATNFHIAPVGSTIPTGERISFSGKLQSISSATASRPFAGRLLVRGSEGEDVKILQERLRDLSYDILWADGKDNYHGQVFAVKGLGPVTVPLSYKEPNTTGRSDIEIHIDWNKTKGSPGTVGCIGISSVTDYKPLVSWLRETDPRDLYVDWGLGTCPDPS